MSLCSLPVGHVRNIAENSIYCVTFINSWFFHTPVFRLSYLLYHIYLSIHVLDSPSIFHLTNSFIPSFTFAPIRLVKAIHLSLRNVHLHFTSSQNKKMNSAMRVCPACQLNSPNTYKFKPFSTGRCSKNREKNEHWSWV